MNRAGLPLVLTACTSLGPMPATTGVSAIPLGRPGVEGAIGVVPGFMASQAAQDKAGSVAINNASFLLDVDRWLPAKGLLIGGRIFGKDGDTPFEPTIGYRRRLIDAVAIGVVGFGSTKRRDTQAATYHGVRLGGEAMADVKLYSPNEYVQLHAQGAVSVTHILASGVYCIDPATGAGEDCKQDTTQNTVISGKFVGVYPAATATLSVDVGGKREGVFNSIRLSLLGSAGQMPLVMFGAEHDTGMYYQLGASISVGVGLGRPPQPE